jgi:hypothetical protein
VIDLDEIEARRGFENDQDLRVLIADIRRLRRVLDAITEAESANDIAVDARNQ